MSTNPANPIFLVGAERSGTTLFRLMLDAHPEINVCSEFEYAVDSLVDSDGWPDIATFHARLRESWIFQEHGFEIDPDLGYPQLVRSFLDQSLRRSGATYSIAVVHRHFDQLPRIWPSARYIHIVRDPRDVARSVVGMNWAGNVWRGAERWIEAERCWDRLLETLEGDRFIAIRQEHLVCSPEKTLASVCAFMGVTYDTSMLEFHRHSTYSRPDPALTSQWRHTLSPREINLVECRVGDLLTRRGYEHSGRPLTPPSRGDRFRLYLHDWSSRVQRRLKLYGLRLFLADYLVRRLNIRSWCSRLDPQLKAIWRSQLK